MSQSTAARVGVICETLWDRKQLQACWPAWGERVTVKYLSPSEAQLGSDSTIALANPSAILDNISATERHHLQGVLCTSGGPGSLLAAAVASRLGLPSPPPEALRSLLDRRLARDLVSEIQPDALSPGWRISRDSRDALPDLPYPVTLHCEFARGPGDDVHIASRDKLEAWLASAQLRGLVERTWPRLERLVAACSDRPLDTPAWIAEPDVPGAHIALEGFTSEDAVEFFGIMDMRVHPRSGWVARYEYPSRLPAHVQSRTFDVARRLVRASGLNQCCFHLDATWDYRDEKIVIRGLYPHLDGQLADLYQKVDGNHAYEAALSLCLQGRPSLVHRQGRYACAASSVLYASAPCAVTSAPDACDLAAAEGWFMGTLVWSDKNVGDLVRCSDAQTSRYAVLNVGARDTELLGARLHAVEERLGFELKAV